MPDPYEGFDQEVARILREESEGTIGNINDLLAESRVQGTVGARPGQLMGQEYDIVPFRPPIRYEDVISDPPYARSDPSIVQRTHTPPSITQADWERARVDEQFRNVVVSHIAREGTRIDRAFVDEIRSIRARQPEHLLDSPYDEYRASVDEQFTTIPITGYSPQFLDEVRRRHGFADITVDSTDHDTITITLQGDFVDTGPPIVRPSRYEILKKELDRP